LKNSNLCDHNSPTSQTDGRTYRQTTCDRNTALCTKVHRAVTKRFEFTPETAVHVRNVLVEQVGRKTVPNTWPGDSEALVAECVVCASWNGTRSVGGRE